MDEEEMKKRLVAAWKEGGDYLAAAQVLNIKTSAALSIIRCNQGGKPLHDRRGERRAETLKLTEDDVQRIFQQVKQHPDFMQSQSNKGSSSDPHLDQ